MRYLVGPICEDLRSKMVFVAGPRQVGKTSLAKEVLAQVGRGKGVYLNWDAPEDRKRILAREWDRAAPLVVFDELHKYNRWKNWLKGIFDTRPPHQQYLITGSARLDTYRRGGDSMVGRFHLWHLHPFSIGEHPPIGARENGIARLLKVGGFPEPFLSNDERFARRWRLERHTQILREDVRDLERVDALTQMEQLLQLLQERTGSPVVMAHLARDLELAPRTVARYLDILSRVFLCFIVPTYTTKLSRAIRKPPKIFFFDNADVLGDEGSRFENLVATHLLKRIQFQQEYSGHRYELRYLRDKEQREVDFVILRDRKVYELWEAKLTDTTPSPHLRYYTKLLRPERSIQVVSTTQAREERDGITLIGAKEALAFQPSSSMQSLPRFRARMR